MIILSVIDGYLRELPKIFSPNARLETRDISQTKLYIIIPCLLGFFFWCIVIKLNIESLPPLWFLLFKRGELIFFFIFAILDSGVWGTESWSEPLNQKQFRIKRLTTLPPYLWTSYIKAIYVVPTILTANGLKFAKPTKFGHACTFS